MEAKDLIKAGKLSEARSLLVQGVKSSPTDLNSRTLLFQVEAYGGEWDKARRQLEIIANQDASRETGVQVYLNLIQAETERVEVFNDKCSPSFLPKTPPYFEQYQEAWQNLKTGNAAVSDTIISDLQQRCTNISGTLNGEAFTGFSETDTRMCGFLEAFVHDHYVWLPMEMLRELILTAPQTLLDLLWASAQITLGDGLALNCYLPVLYPDSCRQADDRLRLGRMTDWRELGPGCFQGLGQHVYRVGADDVGILEIREMVFNTTSVERKDESGN